MAEGIDSLEEAQERVKAFQDSFLEGTFQEERWEGARDFSRQESESVSQKIVGRIRLVDRDIIQQAPLFKRSSEMIGWILENRERIQKMAEEGRLYTYSTIVSALIEAGKIQEHPHRFRAIGSVLEYALLLSSHPDLEFLLLPSVSFRRLLEKGKKALFEASRVTPAPSAQDLSQTAFLSPWKEPNSWEPLPQFLTRLRGETHLDRNEVVALLEQRGLATLQRGTLSEYENGSAYPSLEVLQGLAQIYGRDIRDLIYSHNRSRFPSARLATRHWMTEHYPLWIEGRPDLKLVLYFRKNDPQHESLGWLVASHRKNPFAYRKRPQLADQVGISRSQLEGLEYNRHKPYGANLAALAKALHLSETLLVEAAVRTHYPDLIPALDAAFPGRPIFIDFNEDLGKIRSYVEKPGSIGQILFEHRKSLPGLPTGGQMADRVGEYKDFWLIREANEIEVRSDNLHEWVALFQKAGVPLVRLRPFLQGLGLSEESPVYLLSLAMGGKTYRQVAEISGMDTRVLTAMIQFGKNSTRSVTPECGLKKALPEWTGMCLYRALQPGILGFTGGEKISI
jgi:transcriptional regulator with XRE-family HTH domain